MIEQPGRHARSRRLRVSRTASSIALAVAMVTVVAGAGWGLMVWIRGGETYTLVATFDDVGDLVAGHSVQVADVRVGSITGIELTDDFRARLTMEVDSDVRLPAGKTTALLRTTSLLGEKFVELRPPEGRREGPLLADGDTVEETGEAPELEFIAEQAVNVLGAVTSNDIATLIETGAVGFGDRGAEISALLGDLATFTGALASRTGAITRIIDRLGEAGATLADGTDELDALLLNLADTTNLLVENKQRTLTALDELSRLARIQNTEVFAPYLADVQRQLTQVDAILDVVAGSSAEVEGVVDWLDQFTIRIPPAVPGEYVQNFSWFVFPNDPNYEG
jgi:phospholipid/cholesterol/gamma-HCH transport system substrate-binding protein